MLWRAIALGQLLALLIAATAAASAQLNLLGLSFPTLQSSLNYLLLACTFNVVRLRQQAAQGGDPSDGRWNDRPSLAQRFALTRKWWHYALLALLDVEANFLVVSAYRYSSLTSVTLLDCWSIPVSLLLTKLVLKSVYNRRHCGGAALCALGLAVLVATDRRSGVSGGAAADTDIPATQSDGWTMVYGDILVLAGATLYAGSNVFQEHMLTDVPVAELLSMLGLWGCLWSGAQGALFELPAVLAAQWAPAAALPFLGFAIAMFAFYSLVPFELQWGGATVLNLSLLSADVWTALARVFVFGGFSLWSGTAFVVSFAITAGGIALYASGGEVKGYVPAPVYMPIGLAGGAERGQRSPSSRGAVGSLPLWHATRERQTELTQSPRAPGGAG